MIKHYQEQSGITKIFNLGKGTGTDTDHTTHDQYLLGTLEDVKNINRAIGEQHASRARGFRGKQPDRHVGILHAAGKCGLPLLLEYRDSIDTILRTDQQQNLTKVIRALPKTLLMTKLDVLLHHAQGEIAEKARTYLLTLMKEVQSYQQSHKEKTTNFKKELEQSMKQYAGIARDFLAGKGEGDHTFLQMLKDTDRQQTYTETHRHALEFYYGMQRAEKLTDQSLEELLKTAEPKTIIEAQELADFPGVLKSIMEDEALNALLPEEVKIADHHGMLMVEQQLKSERPVEQALANHPGLSEAQKDQLRQQAQANSSFLSSQEPNKQPSSSSSASSSFLSSQEPNEQSSSSSSAWGY